MKKSHTKYLILDPTHKVFWAFNIHYGFGSNNQQVFEARFTDSLSEATLMDKAQAQGVLQRFSEFEFVVGGHIKTVDLSALAIHKVSVTIEL